MNKLLSLITFIVTVTHISQNVYSEEINDNQKKQLEEGERKISDYVKTILEHYKQEDPVGLPIASIQDPMPIPPLNHSFAMGKMHMRDVQLTGLSKFRIDHVLVDLQAMECEAALTIEKLTVYGNYTLSTWLSKYQGPFTVKLKDVYVKGISKLEVQKSGQLEALDMEMDITFKQIVINFEGLGSGLAGMFQGIINSVGSFVFQSIKPFVLKNANTNLKKDVNEQLHKMQQNFTNSISPLDQILVEVRKKIRNMGYDPYKISNYNRTTGLIGVDMTNTWLSGLSTFHRDGNVTFEIKNNTLRASIGAASQRIKGTSNWEVFFAGMVSRAGTVAFSVEYLKVEVVLSQTLDTRNSPNLEDIQLELGNIAVRCDGAGTLDYVVEIVANILPNMLRYQIMDAVESPIKTRIEEELNAINVEKLIQDNLPALDEQQKSGFKGMLV